MTEWQPPQFWEDKDIEYWKSLDHSECGIYDIQAWMDGAPFYQLCRSMHCGDCGRKTGSQGHLKKVGDKWECPTPEAERNPWP